MSTAKVIEAIRAFEETEATFEQTRDVIMRLTGKEVARYDLENYWKAESVEDFAKMLSTPDLEDWESIDDERALNLIKEALIDPGGVIFMRNAEALEKRYRKTTGFLSDLVFHEDGTCPSELLAKLSEDTVIRL